MYPSYKVYLPLQSPPPLTKLAYCDSGVGGLVGVLGWMEGSTGAASPLAGVSSSACLLLRRPAALQLVNRDVITLVLTVSY